MSPQVTAAIIAASVGVLTLIGTLAAQYFGRRATSRDTQKALAAQSEQLDRTLKEQRTRTLNERFATAAGQLGDDKPSAVRLAGVYAMAGLADDWEENRQTCVDVLCAYLRLPYDPDPGADLVLAERAAAYRSGREVRHHDLVLAERAAAYRASREVRHTVIRVITAHLNGDAAVSWQGLNFDFTGVVFDGGDFGGAKFTGGRTIFLGAEFPSGTVSFTRAEFSGGEVTFLNAEFSGGTVNFDGARFPGGTVYFGNASFSGGTVYFGNASFSGGTVSFDGFSYFRGTVYSGGTSFSGGEIDFSKASDWSFPPIFPWTGTPPPGVKLPRRKEDQSQV